MPDCGDSSCRYAKSKGGMRTNGGCRCDVCPVCGRYVTPSRAYHTNWCSQPDWLPEHHRKQGDADGK